MHLSKRFRQAAFMNACVLSAGLLAMAGGHADDFEEYGARYQLTYNWQRHPVFAEAYSGTNSLTAAADTMYTFSATAHWGVRPWQGGELYFDPEIVQGVPFTGELIGLGGITNGEITRAAGSNPSTYRQRLFLRQTWNQGGGSEAVESNFNQLAGAVDRDRVVLTLGNFSQLDVFDGNAYAKDPRTQFMNWGAWTYSAYDYGADARGFGWGFALEWFRGDWAWRLGRMTVPQKPNELALDFALGHHYADQFEVEHAHSLGGQPGKLRVLFWRNRAVLARFSDALDYLNAHPGVDPQTIFQVRYAERIKYGLGFNIEQALGSDAGLFLRAMQADGKAETQAFTEVDGSLAVGVSLKGAVWQRPADTLGIALMRHTLSAERRRFLEAGGISYFIGDGGLDYRPELIAESFYSLALVRNLWLTADYQRILHPAYNAARGPVDVYALRFHAEF